jgi:predicted O-linked N-acetylglucosamine transferase (SPINDLY family)
MTPELRQHLIQTDTHRRAGHWATALQGYLRIADWLSDEPVIEHNLGLCYFALGNSALAEKHSLRAMQLKPEQWQSALIQAKALTANGKKNQALELLEKLAILHPLSAEINIELGKLLMQHGGDAARACTLVEPFLNTPHHREAAAVLLISQLYDRSESVDAEAISAALCEFSQTHLQLPDAPATSADLQAAPKPPKSPKRVGLNTSTRLKVGLLSPQFSVSPVYFFTYGALQSLANDVDLVFFNRGKKNDWATQSFQALAHDWLDVSLCTAEELAGVLKAHHLDVLVDLGGWMDPVGLHALSVKPAKKMFKWVGGQSATTGLRAFDGYLSDAYQTPPGVDHLYSEPLIRLKSGYVTYTPPPYMPKPEVKKRGYADFGVIANPAKVSQGFLAELRASLPAWRQAQAAQGKKLRLTFIDQRYEQQNIRDRIQAALPGLQIEFVTPANHLGYLKAVGQLDLTLDTWPYSGGLTTIEALAMGVPSLTRSGRLFCERHTESHCFYAGMDLQKCAIDHFTGITSQAPTGRSLLTKNSPRLDHESLANELLFYFHVL